MQAGRRKRLKTSTSQKRNQSSERDFPGPKETQGAWLLACQNICWLAGSLSACGSSQLFFTLSPTLNFSSLWASLSPASHMTYITSVFLPCALLVPLWSPSPISLIFLSSLTPPHSQGLVHSAGLLSLRLSLLCALPDASGCTSTHIHRRNLPLHHTLEWSCPCFLHWQLARPLYRRDGRSDHDGSTRDRTTHTMTVTVQLCVLPSLYLA